VLVSGICGRALIRSQVVTISAAQGQPAWIVRRRRRPAAGLAVRFSGELPSPWKSTTDRLTSLDGQSAWFGVHGERQPSTAVVSSALARPETLPGA
jgi:hypothetical protein